VRSLLAGNKIAYIKTKDTWKTDLKNLTAAGQTSEVKNGVDYEDYLLILLGAKSNEKLNTCYARMLDVMELNLRQEDDTFSFENCVGAFTIQGKLSVNSLFYAGKKESYEYYFEEEVEY
jgi:TATA-box binding protein (TBP) (component of TFIID and TFIIIB)